MINKHCKLLFYILL